MPSTYFKHVCFTKPFLNLTWLLITVSGVFDMAFKSREQISAIHAFRAMRSNLADRRVNGLQPAESHKFPGSRRTCAPRDWGGAKYMVATTISVLHQPAFVHSETKSNSSSRERGLNKGPAVPFTPFHIRSRDDYYWY